MANKYGKNGEAVAAFLDEAIATDLEGWRAFLEGESLSREFTAAAGAAADAPLSASARAAVHSAYLKTFRGLGLAGSDLGKGIRRISLRLEAAAKGLAVRDALSPDQLRVILAPFVAAGFRSVADPVTAPTEQ